MKDLRTEAVEKATEGILKWYKLVEAASCNLAFKAV